MVAARLINSFYIRSVSFSACVWSFVTSPNSFFLPVSLRPMLKL